MPSVNCSVAVTNVPHAPFVVNENGRVADPPGGSAPKLCGALGDVMPGPASSVPTRFVVEPKPEFASVSA